jgi:superfamily II DNA or RNA helicase
MTEKTKEFLQKLKDSGHWNDDYDYSKVDYVNSYTKVVVVDKKFDTEHSITTQALLKGAACCSKNLTGGYLSFMAAKEYVHKLGLNGTKEWRTWCNSGNRPHNIPAAPSHTYDNDGWSNWGDWLGTNRISNKVRTWLSYAMAKEYVDQLNLLTVNRWREWAKSSDRPNNIPACPDRTYRGCGWISWGDWLGTTNTSTLNREYKPFNEARTYVRGLNLKNDSEWREWCKFGNRPIDIPSNPNDVYASEWLSLKDWLGTDIGFSGYLPYLEAREYVMKCNLKTQSDYKEWCKSGYKPNNIPANPYQVYGDDFVSLGHWLGTDTVSNQNKEFLPYDEAREYVHKLGLKNHKEWLEYTKNGDKPHNIPSAVVSVYKDIGWVSWADFLGYFGNGKHQWSKKYMLDFIKSLENELINLDSVELITIINSNNLAKKLRELGSLEDLVSTQGGTDQRAALVHDIIDRLESDPTETEEDTTDDSDYVFDTELSEGSVSEVSETPDETELEPLNPIQELHMYDNAMITASLDDENVDFLLKNQLKKLWNRVLNGKVKIEDLKSESGGDKFTLVKNWFIDEYEEVVRITPPSDYIFKYEPNLMQKLITYRLIKEKRYGNWSGTGAGKTLSAIFAGRYANAKNTLIVCNNATVEDWVNSIHEYFTDNNVYTKRFLDYTDSRLYSIVDKYDIKLNNNTNNYLVLNYETFQLEDGEFIVSELLNNNTIDYIILDEVQNVKQRGDDESTRRNVISKLIIHAKDKNDDLLVMAMSATPVINNLTEPKKLIELLTGEVHDDLNTAENIVNGIEMYKALTRHGLRYKPNYGISVNEHIVESDGEHLADRILNIPRGAVVEFEKALLETKLNSVKDHLKKGTLIYTHYVTELSQIIGEYVKDLGFTIGYYTGEDKSGLRLFKKGEIDILIGSAPIGTGVNGIQYVCNTLIPLVLPWTSSEYDQLVGRVNRQGSNFDHVNIYIPQVVINLGENIWSWDRRRHNIIRFKATLADLAVDGRVPRNLLPSKTQLIEEARRELAEWVSRVDNDNIITFEREELTIPLNPIQINRNRNQLGDFSELNQRWSVTRSDNTHERLRDNPSEWYYYHTLYSEKRQTWTEIPYIEIAKKIKARPDWVVGDFGCGENLLSKEIGNQVYAFDHVAIDDKVYACDIKNVPIEDGILDVAVFSLSLMGSNYTDYFKEAYRTLKTYGNIFICEPSAKWEGREEELKGYIESVGFKCFGAIRNTDKFIYLDGVKY